MQSLNEIRENFEDYLEEELLDLIDEEIKAVRKNKKSNK